MLLQSPPSTAQLTVQVQFKSRHPHRQSPSCQRRTLQGQKAPPDWPRFDSRRNADVTTALVSDRIGRAQRSSSGSRGRPPHRHMTSESVESPARSVPQNGWSRQRVLEQQRGLLHLAHSKMGHPLSTYWSPSTPSCASTFRSSLPVS